MVDHDIVRLDVSVHNAHAVAVVQCAQQLVEIPFKQRYSQWQMHSERYIQTEV